MAFNTVTVGTTATLVVAANPDRISLIIRNNSSGDVFFGDNSSVTTANGLPLGTGESTSEDSGGTKLFAGDVYGIVAAATANVRYWERTRKS